MACSSIPSKALSRWSGERRAEGALRARRDHDERCANAHGGLLRQVVMFCLIPDPVDVPLGDL